MIRTVAQLREKMSQGEFVSRQLKLADDKTRLALSRTNEACSVTPFRKLLDRGEIKPVAFDLAGDAYEWGRA